MIVCKKLSILSDPYFSFYEYSKFVYVLCLLLCPLHISCRDSFLDDSNMFCDIQYYFVWQNVIIYKCDVNKYYICRKFLLLYFV